MRVYHLGKVNVCNYVPIKHKKVLVYEVSELNLSDCISKVFQLSRFNIIEVKFKVDTFLIGHKELLYLLFVFGVEQEYLLYVVLREPVESVPDSWKLIDER